MSLSHLIPPTFRETAISWLREDVPSFDIGGFVVGAKQEVAYILFKANGVCSGIPFAEGNVIEISLLWTIVDVYVYCNKSDIRPLGLQSTMAREGKSGCTTFKNCGQQVT
jgi:hypothetical protein